MIKELQASLKNGNHIKNVFENALSVYSPKEIKEAFANDFNFSFDSINQDDSYFQNIRKGKKQQFISHFIVLFISHLLKNHH